MKKHPNPAGTDIYLSRMSSYRKKKRVLEIQKRIRKAKSLLEIVEILRNSNSSLNENK